ncbi:GL24192 [Drosophila persimilis]|uniref:GL24192 n=1 Tax=Drosophila persimilis TaxID=7234 RepID=B4G4H2_DROPE|nr:GL24192 [Drosophila persimilis]
MAEGFKDLEKFIKFLALKSTQVVVQSRLGEKIQTQCNPLAGNDWFNIVVQDHPEVMEETKRALALKPSESILQRLPLCVEISLKTTEGDQMVLEVWSLDLLQPAANGTTANGGATNARDDSKADINGINGESQTLKASHAIYSRMGIMLKSLISLTRTTPAYKLSRRQCPDSYGIFYRIYVDRPQVHTLGEGHKNLLGSGERRCIDIEKPLRPGAFTDMGKLRQYTEDDFVLPETPPFEWLLRGRQRHESTGSGCSMESLNRLDNVASVVSNNMNNNNNHTANNFNHSHNLNNNSTGFKSFEKQQATNGGANSFSPIKSLLIPATAYRHHSEPALEPPPDDDNLLKELHFPFASPTSHVNDLAKFYRECYHAPPLRGLNELQAEISSSSSSTTPASSSSVAACGPTAAAAAVATSAADASALDDLSRQLEQFETSLEDYDKLVSQFGLTGSSSSGSRSSGGLQMSN